jgi:hypothetical protein
MGHLYNYPSSLFCRRDHCLVDIPAATHHLPALITAPGLASADSFL